MKKIAIVLMVLVFLNAQEIFAGGVKIKFETPEVKSRRFAKEFGNQMEQKEERIFEFFGSYSIRGYVGNAEDKETGKKGSAIGIFVDDEELRKPVDCIWLEDLFSEEEIIKKAKESAEWVFHHLRKLEIERKLKLGGREI